MGDVYVRLWLPGPRCKDNIRVGITAAESRDGLIKLVQAYAFVSVVCNNSVLLSSVCQKKVSSMQLTNETEFFITIKYFPLFRALNFS